MTIALGGGGHLGVDGDGAEPFGPDGRDLDAVEAPVGPREIEADLQRRVGLRDVEGHRLRDARDGPEVPELPRAPPGAARLARRGRHAAERLVEGAERAERRDVAPLDGGEEAPHLRAEAREHVIEDPRVHQAVAGREEHRGAAREGRREVEGDGPARGEVDAVAAGRPLDAVVLREVGRVEGARGAGEREVAPRGEPVDGGPRGAVDHLQRHAAEVVGLHGLVAHLDLDGAVAGGRVGHQVDVVGLEAPRDAGGEPFGL